MDLSCGLEVPVRNPEDMRGAIGISAERTVRRTSSNRFFTRRSFGSAKITYPNGLENILWRVAATPMGENSTPASFNGSSVTTVRSRRRPNRSSPSIAR